MGGARDPCDLGAATPLARRGSHGPIEGYAVYVAEASCADFPVQPCSICSSGLLREAVLRAASWPVDAFDAAAARIAGVILDEIRSLPPDPLELPLPRDPRLLRISQALIDDPADERSLNAWAYWAAIGARTQSRRFVTETGFTFTVWRQRARLLKALEMLAVAVPVNTIALDLGYATPSAFITLFRQSFGETPAGTAGASKPLYRERFA